MPFPLEDVRILDFGQGIAGPYCAQLLGDHGAHVIKVEPPRGDWSRTMGTQDASGLSGSFVAVNRNKQGLCLDLKQAKAIEIAHGLAHKADVVVESFRPGVMDRLGLGFDALRRQNPRLIYCDVTGFGTSGPNVDLPASDSVMQPYGGLMSINGERDGPPLRIGNVVSDMVAGANAFAGVLLALLARKASGMGRRVSVSLLDSIIAFQASPLTEYLLTGKLPPRLGNDHPMTTPSGVFGTSDGAISLTVMDHMWPTFCAGIGSERLANDPRFVTSNARQQNRDALRQELAPVFAARGSAEWIAALRRMDVLCAPINDYRALAEDPQVLHNELLQSVSGSAGKRLPMLRNPVRLEGEPMRFAAPPRVGEHTREILQSELGYTVVQIDEVVASGTVRCA
jgi:crotonobetainyl-CoA:carnitine CoA-transferase CaiB-like acyl-CoA transferase